MAFKLGREKGLQASNGEIKTKLSFKRGEQTAITGTPVIPMPLGDTDQFEILGEANMDGSIYISDKLQPGSPEYNETLNHEMRHATDIKLGKLAYDDNHIMYNGERFERKDIGGVDSILLDGKWKEAGDTGFPWENDANNGKK